MVNGSSLRRVDPWKVREEKLTGFVFSFLLGYFLCTVRIWRKIGENLKICNGFIFLFFSFSGKVEKDTTTIEYFFFLCCSCENVYKRNRDKIKGVRFSFFFLER